MSPIQTHSKTFANVHTPTNKHLTKLVFLLIFQTSQVAAENKESISRYNQLDENVTGLNGAAGVIALFTFLLIFGACFKMLD